MASLQLLDEWDWNFSHHTPTPEGIKKILAFRDKAKQLAETILEQAPDCRERDEALTHLEVALLYANQAIARHEATDGKKPTA